MSFPFYHVKKLKKLLKKNESIYLGDIVINFNKIEKKITRCNFQKTFESTLDTWSTSSFGYTHKKNVEYNKMRKLEQFLLNL